MGDHAFIRPGQAARDAAAAVLADFRCEVDAFCDDDTCTAPEPEAIAWALRLAAELRSVLASLDAQDGAQ
jgi:hypothetical protein